MPHLVVINFRDKSNIKETHYKWLILTSFNKLLWTVQVRVKITKRAHKAVETLNNPTTDLFHFVKMIDYKLKRYKWERAKAKKILIHHQMKNIVKKDLL